MMPVPRSYGFVEEALEKRRSGRRFRTLRPLFPTSAIEVETEGRTMVNFCSNDYLGLSKHPLLIERSQEFSRRYGTGATASRLICGTYQCMEEVEEKLARLKGTEAALILNSGYQANLSLLAALADRHALILSDALNHRSIIEGARLARCEVIPYRHNDMGHLRELLEASLTRGYSRVLVVTESVFSMDGDCGDVDRLASLGAEYQIITIVDEAHATGVQGARGMGLACDGKADICVGTFGKALGSFGAYFALSQRMRDYMVNYCSGFIYSTALPPPVVGAIDAALDLVPSMEKERREIRQKAEYLRDALHALGFDTGDSITQIVPVLIGGEEETLALSKKLEESGLLALAVRPPTVARGESRIRLTLSVLHTDEHIRRLVDGFRRWSWEHGQ